jgi:hypothetical protein
MNQRAEKPRLFIGSSTESKTIAEYVQERLEGTVNAEVWDQGIGEPGAGILESLVGKAPTYDFALMVFGADDVTTSRGQREPSVRDNVLLEFGLFLGHLGKERTFFLYDKRKRPKIPIDLAGIIALTYDGDLRANPRAMVNPSALKIREMVDKHGIREERLRPEPHRSFPERLQYIGLDQQQLLARIPGDAPISQGELEDIAGYQHSELYWRLEQLGLMGLVVKRQTDEGGEYPRYEFQLSPAYARYLQGLRAQ